MEQEKRIELNGVEYVMTPANAATAWAAVKNALKLVQQVNFTGDTKAVGANLIGAVVANLGDPAVKAIEDIIYKHTSVVNQGDKSYRLSDNFDKHFNQYRSHLLPILKDGLMYQFSDFFIGGGGLLKNIGAVAK